MQTRRPELPALIGRDQVLAAAAGHLAEGRSVLMRSRPGDGLTSVARAVAARHRGGVATIVTGLAGLTDLPLAALVLSGLIPPPTGEDPTARMHDGLSAMAGLASPSGQPALLLVEGVSHVDDLSMALLVRAVMDGHVQLIVAAPLGTDLGALHPLLSSDAARTCPVRPLAHGLLRQLAPSGAPDAVVEQAIVLADGAPLWFRACLTTRWVDDGAPLPPALRDLADWHLSRVGADVVRTLEIAALAGAVPVATLAAATCPAAVATACEGSLLQTERGLLLVRNAIHRSRLLERASLHRDELVSDLHRAAAATGEELPLLDTADRPLNPSTARAMVDTAPRAVLDAIDRLDTPLDDGLVLARGRACLETLDVDGAMRDLTSLLSDTTDPVVRADAALSLAIVQAHMLGDKDAARRTLHRAAAGIGDPVLVEQVRARQVVIEVYGRGLPQLADVIPDPTTIPDDAMETRLAVLTARSIIHAGQPGEVTTAEVPVLQELLERTAATAAERWEALVPLMWRAMFRGGFKPAMQVVSSELERARARGDLPAIGTWLHSMSSALTFGGHTQAALTTIRRALAALSIMDRYGLSRQLRLLELRCLVRTQPLERIRADLARIDDLGPMTNDYEAFFLAGVRADIAAAHGDQRAATDLLGECIDHASGIGWPVVGWGMVATSIADVLPPLPAALRDPSPHDCFLNLTTQVQHPDADTAVHALRALAAMGWPAAAAAGARRRGWVHATARQHLEAQHVVATCHDIASPALTPPSGPALPRQLDVARLVAGGATDEEVAARLGLSPGTVADHLARLYDVAQLDGREDLCDLLAPVGSWQPLDAQIRSDGMQGPGEGARHRPLVELLTEAELAVLAQVSTGASNQRIAAALSLSPKTVANHLYRMFPKLGVRSRTEASRLYLMEHHG